MPFTLVKLYGTEPYEPGTMSLTITVPASVPSVFHSSLAVIAVVGRKVQLAPDRRQKAIHSAIGQTIKRAGGNILDQDGAVFGAIGFPELEAVNRHRWQGNTIRR